MPTDGRLLSVYFKFASSNDTISCASSLMLVSSTLCFYGLSIKILHLQHHENEKMVYQYGRIAVIKGFLIVSFLRLQQVKVLEQTLRGVAVSVVVWFNLVIMV
ncbi:hypothetical protein Tco_0039454 [Tanacetum coccineum]